MIVLGFIMMVLSFIWAVIGNIYKLDFDKYAPPGIAVGVIGAALVIIGALNFG